MTLAVLFWGFFAACPQQATGFAYHGPQVVWRCRTLNGEAQSAHPRLPSAPRQLVALWASSKYGSGGVTELKYGLVAAQLLSGSSSERARFAKDLAQKYPLLPEATIDMLLDLASTAFQSATPEELRGALAPGRIDAERPALRRKLGAHIMAAVPAAYLPFVPAEYKLMAAEALVDLALDGLMEASGGVLLAPEVRLYALEQEAREVRRELGWFRCMKYRWRQRKWRQEAGYPV